LPAYLGGVITTLAFLAGLVVGGVAVFLLVAIAQPEPPKGNGTPSTPETSDDF